MDWLKKHLKKIEETNSRFSEEIKKIKSIEPNIFNEFHYWTPLKLAFLNFTLDVCAIVANKWYNNKNFIDLFAGSGINKTKGKWEDFLIGSPFIALLNHHNKFTNFFFCEENPEFSNALDNRIRSLNLDNINLYSKNCNKILDEILMKINKQKKPYNFFFVDPYNFEFHWGSMKKILKIRSDILFTFMNRPCWRTVCTNKKTGHGHKVLNNFFGDGSWNDATNEDDLVKIYKNNIIRERSDAIILDTKIKTSKGFYYTLIFITHKTEGGNPWINPIIETKKEIENHTDLAVKMALDIIKKRQTDLSQF